MKITGIFGLIVVLSIIAGATPKAEALSCLPTEMYLKDIIGDEQVVMFTGTAIEQVMETSYTAEVIQIDAVKQGYVEQEIFVYHEKDETWGYLCNAGPDKKGTKGFYVATRDDAGKYNVTQRLATNDPLIKGLEADLKKAEVVGERVELTKTDRMNQILTTIQDLYEQMQKLFAEYKFWMSSK